MYTRQQKPGCYWKAFFSGAVQPILYTPRREIIQSKNYYVGEICVKLYRKFTGVSFAGLGLRLGLEGAAVLVMVLVLGELVLVLVLVLQVVPILFD